MPMALKSYGIEKLRIYHRIEEIFITGLVIHAYSVVGVG
jgi:hypothetical protein